MRDLLNDKKFSRADILTLQDPAHPEKWDISTFHYVKEGNNEDLDQSKKRCGTSSVRHMNPETRATLETLAAIQVNDSFPRMQRNW